MLNSIESLPQELSCIIKSFLPLEIYSLTNRNDYTTYKTNLYNTTNNENNKLIVTKSYVTKMIREDYDYIFNILLDCRFENWNKPWKLHYKGVYLPCFIELLNYVCIENRSEKCRSLIQKRMKKNGMRKNKHKRIRIVNNTWSN